ncbi:MAG: tetratricopeptide repeat protein [Candidatus Thermoplasmatota archaeon]|nr:tetratricopeptide repeat protein [Candidatus Thermoplasmatota archaeon]
MFPMHERKKTKFVGRSDEFQNMEGLIKEVRSGRGKLVMVEGEAGIGKTRFTEEILQTELFSGFTMLKGRCLYFKDTDIYLPFKEMFNQYTEINRGRYDDHIAPFRDEERENSTGMESALIKEEEFLPMSLIPAETETDELREEMPVEGLMRYDKLSQFIFNLSSESPVCLLIDDLHWADPPSLQLLYYLARRIENEKIFIVCTYRPEDLFWGGDNTHPLAESLKRFQRDRLFTPIKLSRLGSNETNEIIKSILQVNEVPANFSSLIYAKTQGNPFFIEEVLYSIIERGLVEVSNVDSLKNIQIDNISLPSNLKDVIQRRVHWLKPVSIKVIRFASVSGTRINFDIIKEGLELKDEDIIEALEELTYAKFILERGDDEYYEFENPVIQEVIYSELNQSRRRYLHTKMAKVLESRFSEDTNQWANIAMHYYKGKEFEKALDYLTKAASFYQGLAPQRALEYLHLVLDCIDKLPQSDAIKAKNMEVLMDISNLCLQVGDMGRSLEFAEKALNLASVLKDVRTSTRSKLNIADILRHRGEFDMSLRYYEDAIKMAQVENNNEGIAHSYMGIGYIHWRRGDYASSLEMLSKSLQYAKYENNLRTIGKLYLYIGDLFRTRGDLEKSVDYYKRGVKHLETIGDSLNVSRGLSNISRSQLEMGESEQALESIERALEKAKEKGRPDHHPPNIEALRLMNSLGRLKEAKHYYEILMDSIHSEDEKTSFASAMMLIGETHSLEGDTNSSEEAITKAINIFSSLNMPYDLALAKMLLADNHARAGEVKKARTHLEESAELFRRIGAKSQLASAERRSSEIS